MCDWGSCVYSSTGTGTRSMGIGSLLNRGAIDILGADTSSSEKHYPCAHCFPSQKSTLCSCACSRCNVPLEWIHWPAQWHEGGIQLRGPRYLGEGQAVARETPCQAGKALTGASAAEEGARHYGRRDRGGKGVPWREEEEDGAELSGGSDLPG